MGVNASIHQFATGEVSVAALTRVDNEKLRLAAEIQENILPWVIGKGQMRPATGYLGASSSNNQARGLPFVRSVSLNYGLELTNALLRIWTPDSLLTRAAVTSTVVNSGFSTASPTVTMTIATPAVVTWTAHGRSAGDPIAFATTGALPTGVTAGTVYYVIAAGLATDTFRFSATVGGSAINTSGSQSGTHTGYYGWGVATTGGATADINVTTSGALTLSQINRGGTVYAKQAVATSSSGTEHALRIVVTRGPVFFRCGSADGLDDYVASTNLDEGIHSLAFTPSGTYYVEFQSLSDRRAIVDSITVESAGVVSFTAPWATAELREIQKAQSVDVMWLTHTNWQTRKVERRGTTSWSLVKYYADDGPFAPTGTADAHITLTPAAAYGNTTLAASGAAFRSTDVGSLIRTNAGGYNATFALAALGTFMDPVVVFGIEPDVQFTVDITGTWVGGGAGITLYRSTTGPDSLFQNSAIGYVANAAAAAVDPGAAFNNIKQWYRLGFSTYVTGVANVKITYGAAFPGANGVGANGSSSSTGGALATGASAAGSAGRPGIYRITAFNSATSVDVEVLQCPSSVSGTTDWQRGEWSDRRGWPRAVTFHDGRLDFGRADRPVQSVSDNYYSFATQAADTAGNLTVTDASSIQKNLATSSLVPVVNWMVSLQRLIIGTDGSEISARADAFDAPLTPAATQYKDFSTIGSNAVSPVKLDKRAFFVSGAGDKLYQLLYNFEQQDYDSDDLTELNEDIGNGGRDASFAYTIVELFVQRKPQPYIWAIRSDGQVLCLLFSLKHGIQCWTRHLFDGASGVVESGYCLPSSGGQDRIYLWVKRTVNGSTVRYLEKLSLATEALGLSTTKLGDAGLLTAGPVSSVTLAHLASATGLVGWGTMGGVAQPITGLSADGSGVIALGATYTNVWVGLPYTGRYKSAKLAYGGKHGTALLQEKNIKMFGLLAANLHRDALTFGRDFTTMHAFGQRSKDGTAVPANTVHATYDQQLGPFGGGWDTDSRLCLKIAAGYPATLNGVVLGLETNES